MNRPAAISTVSLGWHHSHTLERKVAAAAEESFGGIELFYADLENFAMLRSTSVLGAARLVREMCAERQLSIVSLASFDNFEGSPLPLRTRLASARKWVELANELGTSVVQVPSNDEKGASGDERVLVNELRALADVGNGGKAPVSFAYEALAWGTHVADWEESLRIVELVDRSNLGLCLDQYHVLSRLWADPRAVSGRRPGGAAALSASLERFAKACPMERVMYVQLSDAERMRPPILPGHPAYDRGKDGTHSWCTYGRLFPLEVDEGAYMPMIEVARSWVEKLPHERWVSMEIFHRDMKREACGPEYWASRGSRSWRKLQVSLEAEG